ncbi:hypothetical protein J1TS5_10370 [Paenibacillus macerans]|uniref:helix-turn-helix domain-containing protein n=1 Tax=Paenibacillus macerans TaxID=44252 RepID=UPI001B008979|nr:helix-turn-helix transcriptional regulator [Paenibacillus macerans]GIP08867.1 hypothetical protein J1TS5_10370 [Paenibacillus macerans]
MEIKSNLMEILDTKGITIRQLAKGIDYRYETVRCLCHNQVERLSLDLLAKVCEYLSVDIKDILQLVDGYSAPKE